MKKGFSPLLLYLPEVFFQTDTPMDVQMSWFSEQLQLLWDREIHLWQRHWVKTDTNWGCGSTIRLCCRVNSDQARWFTRLTYDLVNLLYLIFLKESNKKNFNVYRKTVCCALCYGAYTSNQVQGSRNSDLSIGTTDRHLHTLWRSLSAYSTVIASASRRQQIATRGVFQFSTMLSTRWKQLVVNIIASSQNNGN